MLDGFGVDYYRNSDMPQLNKMEKNGLYKAVRSLMPSVTNVNNTSICTGELPEKHGITGNSFFNPKTLQEEFMEDDSLVLAPTIFEFAKKRGVRSMLFSSKKKTIGLLPRGTVEAISPETASKTWIDRIGPAPDIYSREVNY
jgi:phosphonoacetate hydrolase